MKSELHKQQYTVTRFDYNHLAHVIVSWQIQNIFVTVPRLFRSTLRLRAISKYKPQGAYIRTGDLTEGFFALQVWGLIFGGAYFRNFTVSSGYCYPTF